MKVTPVNTRLERYDTHKSGFTQPQHQELQAMTLPLAVPTMICVGDKSISKEIEIELKDQGIFLKKCTYITELKNKISGDEIGVIYVSPLKRSEITSVHRNLRNHRKFKKLPFFAVVPEHFSDRRERELYKSGIRMIFEWPSDKKAFSDLVSRSLFTGLEKVRSTDTDESLKKAVLNRLKGHYGSFVPSIKLDTYNGMVMVRGMVNSLSDRENLRKYLKAIPGVRGLVDVSLKVMTSPISDSTKKKIETTFSELKEASRRTMDVRVDQSSSFVHVLGTAPDQDTVKEAVDRIEKLDGVKKVVSRVIVSPRVYKKDLELAKTAQRVANKLSLGRPNIRVAVKVSASKAILKGKVPNDLVLEQIENAVSTVNGIMQVDNQVVTENKL